MSILKRMAVLGLGLSLVAAQVPAVQAAAVPTAEQVAERTLKSVVLVVALDETGDPKGYGSGFVVAPGVVATNAHVVDEARTLAVRLVGRDKFIKTDRMLSFDAERDLALIRVGRIKAPCLRLGDSDRLKIGQTIYAVGNPMGLEGTFSVGNVSAKRDIRGMDYIQMTSPVSPGSSGGPVVDSSGIVVGITTATLLFGQNLNFAVPGNAIKREARRIGLALGPGGGSIRGKRSAQENNRPPRKKPRVSAGSNESDRPGGQDSLASWFGNKKDKKRQGRASVITLIGDRKTKKYYWPWCAEYKKIPHKRRVEFRSRVQAERAGYFQSRTCTAPGG